MLTKERREELRQLNDSPIAMDGDDVGVSRDDIGRLLDALDAMEQERNAVASDLAAFAKAMPDTRTRCGKTLDCGSNCILLAGHLSRCLCGGDEDGIAGTCPA